jgi:hypothetical protein
MTAPVPRLAFDRDHIRGHCEMIHRLAAPLAGRGKIVVASYGEDPTTGDAITPKVEHFKIGDVEAMTAAILQLSGEQYRNVYAPLAVFKNLPVGKKGTEADIVAVLGLVPDFDDADAARWRERLPLPASYVLETSAGRFQAFNLFDKPEPPAAVKPVAMRLKQFAGCDHGTADVCHVWRIPRHAQLAEQEEGGGRALARAATGPHCAKTQRIGCAR